MTSRHFLRSNSKFVHTNALDSQFNTWISMPCLSDRYKAEEFHYQNWVFPMYFPKIKTVLLALAVTIAAASSTAIAETRYYPGATTPLAVGAEEFQENYASLAGLEGVHVVTEYIFGSAKKYELTDMGKDLIPQIRSKLQKAGLRMLSEEESKSTPGQPTLTFYPAYSGADIDVIKARSSTNNTVAKASNKKVSNKKEHDCCRSSIWASFQQSSATLRDPNSQFLFATWGIGEDTDHCDNRGKWTYDAVLRTIDKFVDDYKKAESERKPKLVTTATDVPDNCSQAWLMNLMVFDTDKTSINESVKPILDELANTAVRCERYSYVIETHADTRADAAYNKILSEARAHAIKDYLLSKNVNYKRLITIAFGESKPIATGNTEQDHAVNRRVVIIPKRDQG